MDKLSSRRGLLLFAHNNSKSTSDTSSAEERDTTAAIEYVSPATVQDDYEYHIHRIRLFGQKFYVSREA